jgi:class 3 adenylate cyclase
MREQPILCIGDARLGGSDAAAGVEHVRCAMDVQRGMAERNANVTDEQRIEFRVGINLGDIMIDAEDMATE